MAKVRGGYAYLTEEQRVFKRYLKRIAFSITGRHFDVCFISDGESLGYTSGEEPRTIFLAWGHPYYKGLSDKEVKFFIMGIFAHELLHQLYTDFDYTRRRISKMPSESVASVFMKFANTLEDPAIEHRAPEAYGGNLLAALRYTIRQIYDKAPDVSHSGSAFGELMSALIDFGDVGFVKGSFTSEDAYKTFIQIAPLYNKGINERSGKKRIDIAEKCMEIARPLWEEELKEDEELREALKELLNSLMSQMGKTSDQANPDDDDPGDGSGSDGQSEDQSDENLSPEEQKAKERREKTLEKIAEAAKEMGLGNPNDDPDNAGKQDSDDRSGSGPDSKESDKESDKNSEGMKNIPEKADKKSDKGTDDMEGSSKGTDTGTSDADTSSSDKTDSDLSGNTGDEKETSENSPASSSKGGKGTGSKPSMHSFDLSPEEKEQERRENIKAAKRNAEDLARNLKQLSAEIDHEQQEMDKESRESADTEKLPDVSCEPLYNGKTAKIMNVKAGDPKDIFRYTGSSTLYAEMVAKNRGKIKKLSKGLKAIFETEKEESRRSTSGQYNIVRGSIATTSRIFDKRRDPGDKADTAVAVAIDCSGSMMNENKYLAARDAACILGEALRECNIPHYMFGFTADCAGADAYHVHYVTWKTWRSAKAHESLSEIFPESDNFDSYAVTYAQELLKEVPQKNKVLIMISDGLPASYAYRSISDGVKKTSKAIKEAKKTASVCGIAIGNDIDSEVLQSMYGANFIHIGRTEDFSNVVIKRLLKTIDNLK